MKKAKRIPEAYHHWACFTPPPPEAAPKPATMRTLPNGIKLLAPVAGATWLDDMAAVARTTARRQGRRRKEKES